MPLDRVHPYPLDALGGHTVGQRRHSFSRGMACLWSGAALLLISIGLLVVPIAAEAQQPGRVYRVGVLSAGSVPGWSTDVLPERLQELGYVEGRNLQIEYRYAGSPESLPLLAEELARLKLDVIVAGTNTAAWALLKATAQTPIVTAADDPVQDGLVQSLAHPGGNVTGVSDASPDLVGKRLQLLKEAAPRIARVAGLRCPGGGGPDTQWREAETAARTLGLTLVPVVVASSDQVKGALEAVKRLRADALLAFDCRYLHYPGAVTASVPAMYYNRGHVEAGALMSYGRDEAEVFRVLAEYVAKILKGAKPADLPIQQPTQFTLVINLKTAKALGLTIPQALLLRADQLIQ
jgi:putative tryptophan/tyrosine transport system substrate-binding protein